MRELYTNNIAYLFPRIKADNTVSYNAIGQPFYCNRESRKRSSLNAMTGTYVTSDDEILKTTTQLQFTAHDRIAFNPYPTDDDYSMIINIAVKELHGRGNKHNTTAHNEYWITIS